MRSKMKGEILTGMLAFVLYNAIIWTYAVQHTKQTKSAQAETVQVAQIPASSEQ